MCTCICVPWCEASFFSLLQSLEILFAMQLFSLHQHRTYIIVTELLPVAYAQHTLLCQKPFVMTAPLPRWLKESSVKFQLKLCQQETYCSFFWHFNFYSWFKDLFLMQNEPSLRCEEWFMTDCFYSKQCSVGPVSSKKMPTSLKSQNASSYFHCTLHCYSRPHKKGTSEVDTSSLCPSRPFHCSWKQLRQQCPRKVFLPPSWELKHISKLWRN